MPARVLPRARLVLGGEASPWSLIDRVRELAPACEVFNHYGPTETTVGVLMHRLGTAGERRARTMPLGRPLPGVRVYVVDAELQLTPAGVPGELLVGGASVARGYLGRPELTAACFVPDPFSQEPGRRLYRTGAGRFAVPRLQVTPDHDGAATVALTRTGGPPLVPAAKRAAQPAWRAVRWAALRGLHRTLA